MTKPIKNKNVFAQKTKRSIHQFFDRSDIPKSDNFELRNWRNWQQQNSDDDHSGQEFIAPPQLQQQGNKQFKRNIPTNNQQPNFGNFPGAGISSFKQPDFYSSNPAQNQQFPQQQNVFDPQTFQPNSNGGDDDDDDDQQFDFQVGIFFIKYRIKPLSH